MRRVSIKGIVIGGIVEIVSSVILCFPLSFCSVLRSGVLNQPTDQVTERMIAAAMKADVPLYVAQLLVGFGCSALGGYVAAKIARHDEVLNGGLSVSLDAALSVCVIISGEGSNPLWLSALLLIASTAFALLGGLLRQRQRVAGEDRALVVTAASHD